jgi:outer membrane receptor protein involved in Fe transport
MNHRNCLRILIPGLWIFLAPAAGISGTAGKISGTISDGKTGAALPGANVVIEGTGYGAVTDANGNFTILNVPPGTVSVKASYLGYVTTTIRNLEIHIDQTTKADAGLESRALVGESIVVVAQRSVVKPDVATSVVAVTGQEIAELPVADVQSMVGLQAGIRGELEIRGGEASEALFQVNGLTLRDPRNNMPISSIALSSVQEVSVERGGFNAEYGQIRSGLINVVTKEGSTSGYFGTATIRYSPYAPKNFGISPFDANSMWLRPYTDPSVCWTGTKKGGWDAYTQSQNIEFAGWNEISRILNTDNDPNNNLSPLAAQRLFMWETRKRPKVAPDYNIDAGFGGPVPIIGKSLGNLRFFAAYRRDREMLLVPLTRADNLNWDGNLRLDSDISNSIKLRVTALGGKLYTQARNWQEGAYIQTPDEVSQFGAETASNLWSTGYFSPVEIDHKALSARLTHFISQKTFYEIQLEHIYRRYRVTAARERDLTKKNEIVPGFFVDEAPFGYSPEQSSGVTGLEFGGHTCKQRDFSKVSATTLKADLTSQVNFNNMVKTGMEIVYNNLDLDYGQIASLSWGKNYEDRVQKNIFPIRAALYFQDKLETRGFIANLGARLDYSDANTNWYNVDAYDPSFFTQMYSATKTYAMKPTKPQWQISPRLGISHPVTENSKLFFNYGHFKQMPSYQEAFRLGRRSNRSLTIFGNPDLILAKTVSYELGYDHSLFNDFLIQVAAFYHDIINEQNQTAYIAPSGVSYQRITSNNYKDIRGFELTLRKNRGRYWTAFGNYTYQVTTRGHFGTQILYQDPSEQKRENEKTQNLYQERPMPSPYARANVTLYSPAEFGPGPVGFKPLGDWTLSLIFDWEAGAWGTHNPMNPLVQFNVQQKDVFDTQLRFVKSFKMKGVNFQLFADVYNALNHRQMSLNAFGGRAGDYEDYMNSLHLPGSTAYNNIPGDDRIGEYRKDGVDYQPMYWRGSIDINGDRGVPGEIYYNSASGKYMEDTDGNKAWREVGNGRIDRILKDKAYINMPNKTSFTFLNPRQIFFGMRITFDLN